MTHTPTSPPPTPPDWQRPAGVTSGVWQYVHQRSIARHYDNFVADTPLCRLDLDYVLDLLGRVDNLRDSATGAGPTVILDLGCGTGRLAMPLSEQGFSVLAVDLSRPMLDELVAKAIAIGRQNVFPIQANLVDLSGLHDESVDHAVCMFSTLGMIQGRRNRCAFLSHVSRVLRPGGRFVLHVHRNWAALREPGGVGMLARSLRNSLRDPESEFGDFVYRYRGLEHMFMHRFSLRELTAELRSAGWKIQEVQNVDLKGESVGVSGWNASGFFVVCG